MITCATAQRIYRLVVTPKASSANHLLRVHALVQAGDQPDPVESPSVESRRNFQVIEFGLPTGPITMSSLCPESAITGQIWLIALGKRLRTSL